MRRWPISLLSVGCYVCGLLLVAPPSEANDSAIQAPFSIRFATPAEASMTLGNRDSFVRSMSPFDRQIRLASDQPISETKYLQFASEQALPWDKQEQEKIELVVTAILPLLSRLKVEWPETIELIKTTGREESSAPHCRGKAIVFPESSLSRDEDNLKRLVLHELFHILSRHSPELRKDLYKIVGYRETAPIPLPNSLAARKITNPDAPQINCVIRIDVEETPVDVTPVLISKLSDYETLAERTLFSELLFRLMVVEQEGDRWKPVLADESPVLIDPATSKSFHRQIGRNTGYIIHPEEIMADNFVHLLLETPELPDPQILEQMREVLTAD